MNKFGKWAAVCGIGLTSIICIVTMGSVVKTIVPIILNQED